MNKFRVIMWYLGILVVSICLILSFITKNWLLAFTCAGVTAILKTKNKEVEIPAIYRKKGISNAHFEGGGKYEKNNK